jgi:uncharacterized membrane protein YqiK
MNKKGDMSIQVIIVAVIALIVLIVLVLIFTGKLKLFGSQTTETSSKFTGKNCVIPGTNNRCDVSADECREMGGSYDDRTEYSDCPGYCCLM